MKGLIAKLPMNMNLNKIRAIISIDWFQAGSGCNIPGIFGAKNSGKATIITVGSHNDSQTVTSNYCN